MGAQFVLWLAMFIIRNVAMCTVQWLFSDLQWALCIVERSDNRIWREEGSSNWAWQMHGNAHCATAAAMSELKCALQCTVLTHCTCNTLKMRKGELYYDEWCGLGWSLGRALDKKLRSYQFDCKHIAHGEKHCTVHELCDTHHPSFCASLQSQLFAISKQSSPNSDNIFRQGFDPAL